MEKDFVKIKPCKKIDTVDAYKNPNGWVLEIVNDRDGFTKHLAGQVYLSTIDPGVEKGYHIHATARYFVTCIKGRIRSTVYKDRFNKQEFESGDDNFLTYELPLGSAHHMKNIGDEQACIIVYRFPGWGPEFKEQLDISPVEIETEEAWNKINAFVLNFK